MPALERLKTVDTAMLHVAYVDDGALDGWPVILSRGFPYDVHASLGHSHA